MVAFYAHKYSVVVFFLLNFKNIISPSWKLKAYRTIIRYVKITLKLNTFSSKANVDAEKTKSKQQRNRRLGRVRIAVCSQFRQCAHVVAALADNAAPVKRRSSLDAMDAKERVGGTPRQGQVFGGKVSSLNSYINRFQLQLERNKQKEKKGKKKWPIENTDKWHYKNNTKKTKQFLQYLWKCFLCFYYMHSRKHCYRTDKNNYSWFKQFINCNKSHISSTFLGTFLTKQNAERFITAC